MATPRVDAGGGLPAILYTLRMAWESGGPLSLWRRMRRKNTCKTCALGMGGQKGGMVNEAGHFPEVCKKSLQAQAGDMQAPVSERFFELTPIAMLAKMSPHRLERLGRLAFPLVAEPGESHFRRISWEDALARAGKALGEAGPQRSFLYMSGRSSNEAAFLAQLVFRAFGSANINNCSFYCHQASGVALAQVYGSGTASVTLEDLDRTDVVVLIGANPASNHPRLITKLMELRRRGGKVIVINPLKELGLTRFRVPSDWRSLFFGSVISDLYVQPKVGGDIALLQAILKGLLASRGVDREFIEAHTTGFAAVEAELGRHTMDGLCAAAGVSRAEVDAVVQMLFGAERGVCMWAMGLTHHTFGVDNVLAVANLALARGWLGKPGAGLLPIRGHSNVQGVGSMGVAPEMKQAFAAKLAELYGIDAPTQGGLDTYACMEAAERGGIDAALLLGGNLFGSNPDATWAARALAQVGTLVHVSTKLNTGHAAAPGKTTLILPALARDEEPQPTSQESMFNYVRLSEGGPASVPGEMRSEVDIVASLAERMLPGGRFDWSALRSHHALRAAIAQVVPGFAPLATLDAKPGDARVDGQASGPSGEFQIQGRTFHAPRFSTPDGRARFSVTPLPELGGADTFVLTTLRSEGQFNSVVYDEEDLYRGVVGRDVVMMNASDAEGLGLVEGDRVEVSSDAGSMAATVVLLDIARGCIAMYYPEANVLVPRRIDARSKTPAFKSVQARIRPVGQARQSGSAQAAAARLAG